MQGPQRIELEEVLKLQAGLRMQRFEVKMDKRDSMMMMTMTKTVTIVTERKSEGDSRNQPEKKAN